MSATPRPENRNSGAYRAGVHELSQSVSRYELWCFLGCQDILLRYRRSILGPWWITLSTGILVGALGLLWSRIFKIDIESYLPYFAIGQVLWTLISGIVTESCLGFVQFEALIKQVRLPYGAYILRIMVRHIIVLAHNLVIIVVVALLCRTQIGYVSLLALPGIMIVLIGLYSLSICCAVICTRYRDVVSIVASALNILYFLSPVMWLPEALGERSGLLYFNPVYYWLLLCRDPLLGRTPPLEAWIAASGSSLVLVIVAIFLLGKSRDRISYWI